MALLSGHRVGGSMAMAAGRPLRTTHGPHFSRIFAHSEGYRRAA